MKELPKEISAILHQLTPQEKRLFACDCAEHVLPYFERVVPQDMRPRKAIQMSRLFASGKATLEQLKEATYEAEAAAYEAADLVRRYPKSGERPTPQENAAPVAAATAQMCSKSNLDIAVQRAIETSIGVVVVAAVGVEVTGLIGFKQWDKLDTEVLDQYRKVESKEREWQLKQIKKYIEK